MTREAAFTRAIRRAKETGEIRFVVYDPSIGDDTPERCYHVATENELTTYFDGCDVLFGTDEVGR